MYLPLRSRRLISKIVDTINRYPKSQFVHSNVFILKRVRGTTPPPPESGDSFPLTIASENWQHPLKTATTIILKIHRARRTEIRHLSYPMDCPFGLNASNPQERHSSLRIDLIYKPVLHRVQDHISDDTENPEQDQRFDKNLFVGTVNDTF
jgi:hypothetical protein